MDIAAILCKIRPGEQWMLNGENYGGLDWLDTTVKPTLQEIEEGWFMVELERKQKALESAVDAFMDGKAREKGFRDRHSFALRAGIPGSSWHAQALVFGAWMDAVNDYCWQVKMDCLAGTRAVPTIETLRAELPVLEGE